MDFSKFDKRYDLKGLKNDIAEAAENGDSGEYKEVPLGNYEVEITKMELTESKKNDPMFTTWFKILNGEFKGSLIFMNQVINLGFQIHIVDEFLCSLDTDVEIKFETYSQYADMIADVYEEVDGNLEFVLEYGNTKKGFPTFTINDVFEKE